MKNIKNTARSYHSITVVSNHRAQNPSGLLKSFLTFLLGLTFFIIFVLPVAYSHTGIKLTTVINNKIEFNKQNQQQAWCNVTPTNDTVGHSHYLIPDNLANVIGEALDSVKGNYTVRLFNCFNFIKQGGEY